MDPETKAKIETIIGGMQCPKSFKCADSGFDTLCKARDFGDDRYLQCLEDPSHACDFAKEYDYGVKTRFCTCPLRVYLAKNLETPAKSK